MEGEVQDLSDDILLVGLLQSYGTFRLEKTLM